MDEFLEWHDQLCDKQHRVGFGGVAGTADDETDDYSFGHSMADRPCAGRQPNRRVNGSSYIFVHIMRSSAVAVTVYLTSPSSSVKLTMACCATVRVNPLWIPVLNPSRSARIS
jgi:hypothetical protein